MRKPRAQIAAAVGCLVAAGLVSLVGGQTAAYAGGYGCSGSLIKSYPATSTYNGTAHGYLRVYYSSSTGKNCIALVDNGSNADAIRVYLSRCAQRTPGPDCAVDSRDDWKSDPPVYDDWHQPAYQYSSYAGPLSIYAPNSCISFYGEIDEGSRTSTVSSEGAVHCG